MGRGHLGTGPRNGRATPVTESGGGARMEAWARCTGPCQPGRQGQSPAGHRSERTQPAHRPQGRDHSSGSMLRRPPRPPQVLLRRQWAADPVRLRPDARGNSQWDRPGAHRHAPPPIPTRTQGWPHRGEVPEGATGACAGRRRLGHGHRHTGNGAFKTQDRPRRDGHAPRVIPPKAGRAGRQCRPRGGGGGQASTPLL